jgi:hypothetical protein
MFIRNPLTAGLETLRARASVPSVGGNGAGGSVSFALERVAVAEKNLQAARGAARVAARQAGVDTAGLFSEGMFVARSTAERWRDEGFEAGRRKGEKAMADIFTRTLDMDAGDENSKFKHLARRLKKMSPTEWADHVARMRAARDDPRNEQARALVEAGEHDAAAAIYVEIFQGTKADQIVRAGKKARMSADAEIPDPAKGSLAAQIVRAGARRRGEIQ